MKRTNQDPDLTEAIIEAEAKLEVFFRNRGGDLRESIEILERELEEYKSERARLRAVISRRDWGDLASALPRKTVEALSGYDSPALGEDMRKVFEDEQED